LYSAGMRSQLSREMTSPAITGQSLVSSACETDFESR
jgi:hypothetical protein